jgi:hypothetical protein
MGLDRIGEGDAIIDRTGPGENSALGPWRRIDFQDVASVSREETPNLGRSAVEQGQPSGFARLNGSVQRCVVGCG